MKKLSAFLIISLLLMLNLAHAIMIQRAAEGYVLAYDDKTGTHCFAMPQHLDLEKIPRTPMSLQEAAEKYKWAEPIGEQLQVCLKLKEGVWKVQAFKDYPTRPVYQIDEHGKKTTIKIDVVEKGKLCGDFVQAYSDKIKILTWRKVIGNANKEGVAVCKRQ